MVKHRIQEPFYMLLRMYLPNIEVLNGQYLIPGVKRFKMNTKDLPPSKIGAGLQISPKPPTEGFLCPGGLRSGRVSGVGTHG
jgi:hypothetical protein